MRPIDADAVFPWYLNAFNGEIGPRDIRFSMLDIKENLYNIQPLEIPHWTPCSEKLPDQYKHVLVTTCELYIEIGYYDGKAWSVGDGIFYRTDEISAWYPLPEPYKEEKHGE